MLEISFVFDETQLLDILNQTINALKAIVLVELEEEKREAMCKYATIFANKVRGEFVFFELVKRHLSKCFSLLLFFVKLRKCFSLLLFF